MPEEQEITYHSKRRPIKELDGYDLVESGMLRSSNGFQYIKEAQGTNTSGSYGIFIHGERVGHASLSFALRDKRVGFDIAISKQGHNLGAAALRGLADTLDDRDFSLVTAGIMPESRGYWEHLAEKGEVVPLDPHDPDTQYRVIPTAPIGPDVK